MSDPFENSQDNDGVSRVRSLDDLAIVDYEMFEDRRGSDQSADVSTGGYMRMRETSRESVNMNNVAMARNGNRDISKGSNQLYGVEEQVLAFMAEGGDQNVQVLESWFNPTGGDVEPRQSKAKNEPVYSEVGAQIPRDDPIYSEVGSQIRNDESIYSEVGSQIPK